MSQVRPPANQHPGGVGLEVGRSPSRFGPGLGGRIAQRVCLGEHRRQFLPLGGVGLGAAAPYGMRAELVEADQVRRERDGRVHTREDSVHLSAGGEHVAVEITVATAGWHQAVNPRLEADAGLMMVQDRGRRDVDDVGPHDGDLVAAAVGHHEDVGAGVPSQCRERDMQLADEVRVATHHEHETWLHGRSGRTSQPR